MKAALRVTGVVAMVLAGLLVLLAAGASTSGTAFLTGLALAVFPVPVYIAMSLWIDRFEREPRRLILFAFGWGATVAVLIAFVLNTLGEVVVGLALGGGAATIYGGSISAPVVEESAKAAALLIVFLRRPQEFNGIVDGIVYATMVGLGFAATENVLYYSQGAFEEGAPGAVAVFALRGLLSPFAHPLFTAMTGIGLGLATRTRNGAVRVVAPLAGLGAAMMLHSIWNTAAVTGLALFTYFLLFVPIFIALLVIAIVARAREGQLVRRFLWPEAQAGTVTPRELEMLSSIALRRRALRTAKRSGGKEAGRALLRLQEAATELAFHRERTARGLASAAHANAGWEKFVAALRELRERTGGQAVA